MYNNSEYFYQRNIQGDVVAIYDTTGSLKAKYTYDAYGNHIITNYDVSQLGDLNPFRYRGYYYDVETNLYYLQSRYYDPKIGRFISKDHLNYLDPKTIGGLNLYAYCAGNPVMYTDSSGTSPWIDYLNNVRNRFNSTAGRIITTLAIAAALVAFYDIDLGRAAPLTAALGGGLWASVAAGAIMGTVSGAVYGAGFSLLVQGITSGYANVDWKRVGIDALSGAISGAVAGGVFGGIKYFFSAAEISNAVSGLNKAQAALEKASDAFYKTTSAVKRGRDITKQMIALAKYAVANQAFVLAKGTQIIAELAFKGVYMAAQFGLKQLIGYYVKGGLEWKFLS
jgi:RHS repeat-associated protein